MDGSADRADQQHSSTLGGKLAVLQPTSRDDSGVRRFSLKDGAVAVGTKSGRRIRRVRRLGRRYATASHAVLRIMHAWIWPVLTRDVGPVKGVTESGLRHAGAVILAKGVPPARSH